MKKTSDVWSTFYSFFLFYLIPGYLNSNFTLFMGKWGNSTSLTDVACDSTKCNKIDKIIFCKTKCLNCTPNKQTKKIMKFQVMKTILVPVYTHVRTEGSRSAGTIVLSVLRCENNNE